MASLQFSVLILSLSLVFLQIAPSHSLNCTSQKFTNNKVYTNCTDLPYLNSYLHWTYDQSKSSLSIAFVAPPAKSDGWIAWAINPTGTGMLGAQSLIALKDSNGSMTVKTFNISSYKSISESKISFDVPDKSAEFSGGLMKIFATVTLPENFTTLNQVWQVGSSVTDGTPDKHDFQTGNMNSKGTLELAVAQKNGTTSSPPPTSANNNTSGSGQSGNSNGGGSRIIETNIGFSIFLIFIGSFVFCF